MFPHGNCSSLQSSRPRRRLTHCLCLGEWLPNYSCSDSASVAVCSIWCSLVGLCDHAFDKTEHLSMFIILKLKFVGIGRSVLDAERIVTGVRPPLFRRMSTILAAIDTRSFAT